MAKGFKHGTSGGANPLNFQVKTYPSETELKADKPRENTIGVITTTTMRSWVFSDKEPTEPEVGMVWFYVGDSSPVEFNALKNNTLQVYPLSAKQYVGGAFEEVVCWSYQNGEWVEWIRYIFNDGEVSTSSGGFTDYEGNAGVTIGNTIIIKNQSTSKQNVVGTNNKIPVADCSVLKVDCIVTANKGSGSVWNAAIAVSNVKNGMASVNEHIARKPIEVGRRTVCELDISTVTQDVYICFGGVCDMEVYKIWLE